MASLAAPFAKMPVKFAFSKFQPDTLAGIRGSNIYAKRSAEDFLIGLKSPNSGASKPR
jgi:hypothetical protein